MKFAYIGLVLCQEKGQVKYELFSELAFIRQPSSCVQIIVDIA